LLENALHHTGADAKFPADLEDAVAVGLQFENSRFHGWINPAPTELCSIRPGARETGIHSLANNPALELSKYAQHLKHRLAGGRRTIESLLVKEQADPLFMKALSMPSRSVSDRPSRSTDHVATMSNSFAFTAFIMASSPGR
jgi:hypothetical protein